MYELVLKAVGLGIVLIFMIGPVFFSLIQTSIEKGFATGAAMAFGIAANDATFIIVSYFGFSRLLEPMISYLGIIGGMVLIVIGIITALGNKGKIHYSSPDAMQGPKWKYFVKGYLVNAASPFVIIFWLATVGAVTSDLGDARSITFFFGIVVLTILAGDLTKAALASKLKRLITTRLLKLMNYTVAFILVVAGIRLFFVDININ